MTGEFFDQFGLVAFGSCGQGRNSYIGSKEGRVCRFCFKSEPEVSFKNEAHAIPRFLGNKQLVLRLECDDCNSLVSRSLEDHLDKYTKPFRTFGFVKGRNAIPGYLHKDESRIKVGSDRNVKVIAGSDDFIETDIVSRMAKLTMEREPFIPSQAYKALCKIAVSVIDNQFAVDAFRPAVEWCMSSVNSRHPYKQLWLYEMKIPGGGFKGCIYRLWVRRNPTILPNAIFVIGFGFTVLQIAVPTIFDVESDQQGEEIPFFPDGRSSEDIDRYGVTQRKVLDFSSTTAVSLPELITIRFKEYEEK
ncbi:HNH endonuclease [Pseudomonas aeruginosa]|uniref:HNH endonuclease n=1 Tax=Pseudomonas aeruginosa TaxID=287 RepID=UPI0015C3D733|nr:HNH endonuclease [Pseudomonas aeruginosa]QLF20639.1 hypothetical protein GNT46_08685 [Pseudomonas aeruginosa]